MNVEELRKRAENGEDFKEIDLDKLTEEEIKELEADSDELDFNNIETAQNFGSDLDELVSKQTGGIDSALMVQKKDSGMMNKYFTDLQKHMGDVEVKTGLVPLSGAKKFIYDIPWIGPKLVQRSQEVTSNYKLILELIDETEGKLKDLRADTNEHTNRIGDDIRECEELGKRLLKKIAAGDYQLKKLEKLMKETDGESGAERIKYKRLESFYKSLKLQVLELKSQYILNIDQEIMYLELAAGYVLNDQQLASTINNSMRIWRRSSKIAIEAEELKKRQSFVNVVRESTEKMVVGITDETHDVIIDIAKNQTTRSISDQTLEHVTETAFRTLEEGKRELESNMAKLEAGAKRLKSLGVKVQRGLDDLRAGNANIALPGSTEIDDQKLLE